MIPLPDRMRPKRLAGFVGQRHLLGEDKILYNAIKHNNLFSVILWGPPGVGKTTLARIIAHETDTDFVEFSAVSSGIAEIKKLFQALSLQKAPLFNRKTIVFIDEIHRFNKAQQDAFLPYVENGTIILIGATTENPSFEIIGPLLSRSKVLTLKPFEKDELNKILEYALKDKDNGLGSWDVRFGPGARDAVFDASSSDARGVLNTLELAFNLAKAESADNESTHDLTVGVSSLDRTSSDSGKPTALQSGFYRDKIFIEKVHVLEAMQNRTMLYDKNGDEHYNTVSAFIKSMRASDIDATLYYLARMVESGEDPLFIARRMVIFASEDIGMVQPTALVVANEVFRACEVIGYPECQINLAHGACYLASAKKDRSAYDAYFKALEDAKKFGNLPIPLNLRNAPTKLMKSLEYGKGYKQSFSSAGTEREKYTNKDLLPEKLQGKKYY